MAGAMVMNEIDSTNAHSVVHQSALTSFRGTAIQSSGLASSTATLDAFSEVFARKASPQTAAEKSPSPKRNTRPESSPREINSTEDEASDGEADSEIESVETADSAVTQTTPVSESVNASDSALAQIPLETDHQQDVDLTVTTDEPKAQVVTGELDNSVAAAAAQSAGAVNEDLQGQASEAIGVELAIAGNPDDRAEATDPAVTQVAAAVQAEDSKRTEKTKPAESNATVPTEKTAIDDSVPVTQTPDPMSAGQGQSGSSDGRSDRGEGPSERFTNPQKAPAGQLNSSTQAGSSGSQESAIESSNAAAESVSADSVEPRVPSPESSAISRAATVDAAKSVAPGIVGVSASSSDSAGSTTRSGQLEPVVGVGNDRIVGSEGAAKSKAAQQGTSVGDTANRVKLIQRVSKAFQHVGADGGSIRIRLAPEELGTVRIEMQVQNKQVRARVVAETDAASQVLRENLPDLRSRLETLGVAVEQIDVETEGQESTLGNFGGNHQSHRESNDQSRHDGRHPPVVSPFQQSTTRPAQAVGSAVVNASISGVDLKL